MSPRKAVIKTTLAFVTEAFAGGAAKVPCSIAKFTWACSRRTPTEAATATTVVAAVSAKATFARAAAELAVTVPAEAATWIGPASKAGA